MIEMYNTQISDVWSKHESIHVHSYLKCNAEKKIFEVTIKK